MNTFTRIPSGATLVPWSVSAPWQSTREIRSIQHEPLDNPSAVGITYRPPGPRTGTFQLFFITAAAAVAAAEWFASWPTEFSYDAAGGTPLDITRFQLTPGGRITCGMASPAALSDAGEFLWRVDVPWTEIPA